MTTTSDTFTITFNIPGAGPEARSYTLRPSNPTYPVMLFLCASLATTDGVTVEAKDPSGGEIVPGYVPMFLLDFANEILRGSPDAVPGLMHYYGPPVTASGARAFHFNYSALGDWNTIIGAVLDTMPEDRAEAIRAACAEDVAGAFTENADKIRDAVERGAVSDLLNVPNLGPAFLCAFSILPESEAMGLVMHSCGALPEGTSTVQ